VIECENRRGFGLLIGFIGPFNIQLVTTIYKSQSHRNHFSQSWSSRRRLVAASTVDLPLLAGSIFRQAGGHLTPTYYSSNGRLKTLP
jgi:hypothetical protein